jgi:hypothetical protein
MYLHINTMRAWSHVTWLLESKRSLLSDYRTCLFTTPSYLFVFSFDVRVIYEAIWLLSRTFHKGNGSFSSCIFHQLVTCYLVADKKHCDPSIACSRLGGIAVSVIVTGPRSLGFKPDRGDGISLSYLRTLLFKMWLKWYSCVKHASLHVL